MTAIDKECAMDPPQIITIDGPVASGKGTVASVLAKKLGWHLLDSGALYRLTALSAMRHSVDLQNEAGVAQLAEHLDVQFQCSSDYEPARVFLAGESVEQAIRSEECGQHASVIAAFPQVRTALIERQRAFARTPGLVADGRDMGTVIFPDAVCKIFLTASVEQRAKRRYEQLQARGYSANLRLLLEEIAKRDENDQNRPIAPLKAAPDAVVIDSTSRNVEDVVQVIYQTLKQKSGASEIDRA